MSTTYVDWLQKANEDEGVLRLIITDDEWYAAACFHAQQATEKHLKALCVYYNIRFSKTHDLLELETLLRLAVPGIAACHDDFVLLNRYSTELRYPGDEPPASLEDAKTALQAVEKIKFFVESVFSNIPSAQV